MIVLYLPMLTNSSISVSVHFLANFVINLSKLSIFVMYLLEKYPSAFEESFLSKYFVIR